MAKIKLGWFKLDCQPDDKIELIESEFGLKGFAVIVKLYQKIYGSDGYYCEWNDEVALLFAKRNNVSVGVVSEIVQAAIKRGIFDTTLFEKYGILTSHGIQVRYFDIADRRKGVNPKKEYLLLCNTQNQKKADKSSRNVDISSENDNIFSQTRREEKRRDKMRTDDADLQKIFDVQISQVEYSQLVNQSDVLSVQRYLKRISEWQETSGKKCRSPFDTISRWISQDKNKNQKSRYENKDTSYDLDEFEEYALNFNPNESGGADDKL